MPDASHLPPAPGPASWSARLDALAVVIGVDRHRLAVVGVAVVAALGIMGAFVAKQSFGGGSHAAA